ncbi:MAG: penicillin acylase family protein, partial [Halobacteriaceae archaeon]
MNRDTTRRGILAAILGGSIGGLSVSPVGDYLQNFAPGSGDVWQSTARTVADEVDSPYGAATITYDEYHVPHVEADTERAGYYA